MDCNPTYFVICDHQIVAVNRRKEEHFENSIAYRDDAGILYTINLERCAENYADEYPGRSTNCVGERNVCEKYFIFYTSGIKTKIVFKRKYVFQTNSDNGCKYKLLTGERADRFHQFQAYINETRYTTLDLS